jgi:hypothetical protein
MREIENLRPYATTTAMHRALDAIEAAGGNLSVAARTLGVSRSTIRKALDRMRSKIPPGNTVEMIPNEHMTPRGPSGDIDTHPDPVLEVGQELAGQSALIDADGKLLKRWDKSRVAGLAEPDAPIVPPGHVVARTATMLRADGTVGVQWITAEPEKAARWAAFEAACKDVAEKYAAGRAEPVPAPTLGYEAEDWLNVFPLGDPHIGMLAHADETGDHHDLKIADADLRCAINMLDTRAPAAGTAYLLNLGDYFHAESNAQVTPGHGNKLDVDGRYHKVLKCGLNLLAYMAETLLRSHRRVIIGNVRGNHDPEAALMIGIWLEAWFRHEPRVEVLPNVNAYHALEFGRNMIATCHGDGAKRDDVPLLFATRFAEMWGRTRYRRCYSGHVHHKTESEKELGGMVVRTFRTLAGKDAYHAHKGYDAGRSLDVISHHKHYGPCATATVDIEEVRDELRAQAADARAGR